MSLHSLAYLDSITARKMENLKAGTTLTTYNIFTCFKGKFQRIMYFYLGNRTILRFL